MIYKLRNLSEVCGANVITKNYKINYRTCIVIAVIFLFYIFSAYTIYSGWGDIAMIFKSLSIYGCAIQVISILILLFFKMNL